MSNNRVLIGLRFFFAPLEPGPGRGAKIDNPLPTRFKNKNKKTSPDHKILPWFRRVHSPRQPTEF